MRRVCVCVCAVQVPIEKLPQKPTIRFHYKVSPRVFYDPTGATERKAAELEAAKPRPPVGSLTPAGRVVVISNLAAFDVPAEDKASKGKAAKTSDPYLRVVLCDEDERPVDEAATPYVRNTSNPSWSESLRLFLPSSFASPRLGLRVELMDKDWNTQDDLLGFVEVELEEDAGDVKQPLETQRPSKVTPQIALRYTVLPQMYYEQGA